jgi:alkylresorcinol/alkylpyrone synthase
MFFLGLGTAVPEWRYTQKECLTAFQESEQYARLDPRARALLKKILSGENGIVTRHLAVPKLGDAFELTPDSLQARFTQQAPELATRAAEHALTDAVITAAEIDAVIISTCTGYLCPGLTSYVTERLGLRSNVLALDLVGQGCGAALPNLRMAEALVASGRAGKVLSVCVEVCSAAFYLDNDPGVLISAALFGDGAGAAVLSQSPPAPGRRRIEWKTAGTTLSAEDRDYLRFEHRNGMLRNILARQVPALAAKHANQVLTEVLKQAGLARDQITAWIMHAGGREVLHALQKRLLLSDSDLLHSAAVLREFGNVSSPFVFFVLEKALRENAPGGWWWMSSFGAGFSCHGAVLRVD